MKKMPKFQECLLLIVALACVGCAHMHRVVNVGDRELYGVTVRSGRAQFGHGFLQHHCYSTYIGSMSILRSPPPVVSWKTEEQGPVSSQEVQLDVSPRWREVVFELDGTTVKGFVRDRP